MLNQYLSGHLIVTHHKMYMNLGCSTRGYDCLQLQMILVHLLALMSSSGSCAAFAVKRNSRKPSSSRGGMLALTATYQRASSTNVACM